MFNNGWLISIAFVGLYATYFVGVYAEFATWEKQRVPPFPIETNDTERPKCGWLGKDIARFINFKYGRMLATAIFYLSGSTFGFFRLYAFFLAEVENLRRLPTYNNWDKSTDVLVPLVIVW